MQEMLLTRNEFSRPGTKLQPLRGVVIHWVANPGSSAQANRNFFENRKLGKTGYGSAHYIIGLAGEVIRCLPESEMGYHVGSTTYTDDALRRLSSYPNNCTIGIECCHIDWDGRMTDETYDALVDLTVDLLRRHNLDENDLWLHKEVVGWKDCHRWFVNNPGEWAKFKQIVSAKLKGEDDQMLKQELEQLKKQVEELQNLAKMKEIPEWAKEAVDAAVQKGLVHNPEGGSYDFYRFVTIMHRKGII